MPGPVFVLSKWERGWNAQSPRVMVSVPWGLSTSTTSAKFPGLGRGATGRPCGFGLSAAALLRRMGASSVLFRVQKKIPSFRKILFYHPEEPFPQISRPQGQQRGRVLTIPLAGNGWEWAGGSMAKGLL